MTTSKYEFENVSVGTSGWASKDYSNMELVDSYLHTYITVTLEEAIDEGSAVAIVMVDAAAVGKYARAGSTSLRKPAIGIAVESGDAAEDIQVQRVGPITFEGWDFTKIGRPVYLGGTNGSVTQIRPSEDIQMLGVAKDSTTLLLFGNASLEGYVEASTTTTTTTTTTSTT